MNELLQKHGCANVFHIPDGLKELMSDISREVLRLQPKRLNDFIANYLSALLITREHGIMAMKILEDLCDCRPSVSEHLLQLGIEQKDADIISGIIKEEIEAGPQPEEGKEKIKEYMLLKKILAKVTLDEEMSAQVCQVARNAYKDYCYRKELLKQGIKMDHEEPWEIAARNTLNLYKKTKPSLAELNRATEKIQAAYRGYHIRRHVLRHLLPKKDKRQGRKVDLSGPPLDIASSREVALGPVINIRAAVKEDNVAEMFDTEAASNLGLKYNPMKTITNVEEPVSPKVHEESRRGVKIKEDDGETESRTIDDAEREVEIKATHPSGPVRISFSEIPPEVIEDSQAENPPEIPEEAITEVTGPDIGEIIEDVTAEYATETDISGVDTTPDITDAEADTEGEAADIADLAEVAEAAEAEAPADAT